MFRMGLRVAVKFDEGLSFIGPGRPMRKAGGVRISGLREVGPIGLNDV